jgi:hypothetical protein
MEHLETYHHLPSIKTIEETFKILKTKHSLPSPFVVLSNHSVYVVFLDPHQGIDDCAFFLPTSKSFMWSSGRDECKSILALHIL